MFALGLLALRHFQDNHDEHGISLGQAKYDIVNVIPNEGMPPSVGIIEIFTETPDSEYVFLAWHYLQMLTLLKHAANEHSHWQGLCRSRLI